MKESLWKSQDGIMKEGLREKVGVVLIVENMVVLAWVIWACLKKTHKNTGKEGKWDEGWSNS